MRAFALALVALVSIPVAHADEVQFVRPRGVYKIVPVPNADDHPTAIFGMAPPKHRILYMNRYGGVFMPGSPDNSSLNISSVPDTGTATIPPFPYGDDVWNDVMACVRDIYAPFNITVTEEDPGDAPHIESVVGGQPGDVGAGDDVGGVAPASPGCAVVERAIVYTFDVWGQNVRNICETVAQESAHAFGLDHEFLCQDPMTYLFGCGPKTFQDVDAECGEYEPSLCKCGGMTQNSVQMLLGVLGEPDRVGPSASISEPADGATVSPQFHVIATADDDVEITGVELWVDGQHRATLARPPYDFTAPPDLTFEPHLVEVRAVDFGGNVAIAAVNVTIDAECQGTTDCPDGDECSAGVCLAGLSTACANHEDCASGTCARDPAGELACSTSCDPADAMSCPDGFDCGMTDSLCWPAQGGGGGGCAAGRTVGSGAVAVLVLGLLGLALRRRR
jgi:hypothetical protein